ncbi:MAG: TlpA family protein disulfide reductase [Arenimonas sp.]|uniref:TlpA family protein disulfide reductase n=1 Tax=Arenimonas sp. TaxID=1872635 RepID=UPI0025C2A3A3|nr:TlpA disulfide reductase family protein [Arenimonas sp.]MBW8366693.1 TlpA family protein disulfide reductase [Arenimonas sp.]
MPHPSLAWLRVCALLLLMLPALASAQPAKATAPQPQVGEIPPDSLGTDRQGQPVSISQHRGKVVIVTFWASWCGPCRKELPMLGQVQKTVGRDYMEVIAVNLNESPRLFNSVVKENPGVDLTWVRDRGKVGKLYGVRALPNMFIIDRDGRIAHTHLGYSEKVFKQLIDEILALLPPEALAKPAGT